MQPSFYSPLSLPTSIFPSFSLSLRGVSTEQKVPEDKQKMVRCCCHRTAVCAPGLDSRNTDRRCGCRYRGVKDTQKEKKRDEEKSEGERLREKEGTEESRQATLTAFASWESTQTLIKVEMGNKLHVNTLFSLHCRDCQTQISAFRAKLFRHKVLIRPD